MPWEPYKLKSVEEMGNHLLSYCARGGMGRWVWRGEPSTHDTMLPKLCRRINWKATCEQAELACEREELSAFTNFASDLLRVQELLPILHGLNTPSLSALEFAQHHGCRTRLVDWTWSPWVALYFACWKPTGAGRMYWFDVTELERVIIQLWPKVGDIFRLYEHKKAPALDEVLFREGNEPWIVVHKPTRMFERVLAQQGVFTVASRLDADHRSLLGELLPAGSACCMDIPDHGFKVGILAMLRQMNVHTDSLRFPALDYLVLDHQERARGQSGL